MKLLKGQIEIIIIVGKTEGLHSDKEEFEAYIKIVQSCA